MGNCGWPSELSVSFTVTSKFPIPTVEQIAYTNPNSKAMHWAAIYHVYTPVSPHRNIYWKMKASSTDIRSEAYGVEVLDFFRLSNHGRFELRSVGILVSILLVVIMRRPADHGRNYYVKRISPAQIVFHLIRPANLDVLGKHL